MPRPKKRTVAPDGIPDKPFFKIGDVATVALIDKGSVVVAILLAWLLLKEVISLRIVLGAALIIAGLLVIAKKT